MLHKTYKLFNQSTRQALFERVKGYVVKSYNKGNEIAAIGAKYNIKKFYRFDLGENVLGFSPMIYQFLLRFQHALREDVQLNNYPEVVHARLRRRIAERHSIDPNRVVISTGLDAILDLITRVFFDPKDYYLTLSPSFYLFEEYSERMGAIPIFIKLDEKDNFKLTRKKVDEIKEAIINFKPKIVWIANPNNPTGQVAKVKYLKEIIELASEHNSFVVVDEAYIEFLKHYESVSMIKMARYYQNLMVLRTFSKTYGLAGIRVGYLISYSNDIVDAMLMLRTHFPVTQLALNMASLVIKDNNFLDMSRKQTRLLTKELFNKLSKLENFKYIPTYTNIFLLKHLYLSDRELEERLIKKGIVSSQINSIKHQPNKFIRLTVRFKEDNDYLIKICETINSEKLPINNSFQLANYTPQTSNLHIPSKKSAF